MRLRRRWQFSIRTILVLALVAGPAAGAFSGTFGTGVQELLIMMLVMLLISLVLAALSTVIAFIILSPLLVVENYLRRSGAGRDSDQLAGRDFD